MANLVDTSVNGDLRVTGTMFGTQAGNYATCATAAGTAAKAVTISGFTLTTGIHVFVKFTVTNTAAVASLTLNVSGTGAKAMKYRGGNLPAVGTLSASRVYEFIYDGTNWELVGDLDTNTQTVTGVKGNAESSYRTGQVNLTAANIGASASDHTHGNITNGGALQTNDITIANGDKLVVTDSSDSSKVARTSIAFDGSTTTQALTKAGTWATFNNYSLPLAASGTRGGIQIGYSESGTNYAVKLSSEKAYVTVPWTDTKVTQTLTNSADAAYPILVKNTTETSNVTDTTRFAIGVTLNPKNKSITATTFIGALSGNASTATSATTATNYASSGGIATALAGKANQFALDKLDNTVVYTTFARLGIANPAGCCEAQLLFSSVVNYGDVNMGTWLVTVSNRGSTASTPKATMVVRCINRNNGDGVPEFGYYYDTANSYIYFGVKCPSYRGKNTITILSNYDATIRDFGDSASAPSGWTPVTGVICTYLPSTINDGQVVLTDGTKGTLKTSAASSLSVGSATKATQDSDGKQINSTYLKLSGDTMTGKITAQAGQYTDDNVTCAINMNNSNIIGLNSIYTADASDGASEGIHFYRDATHVDTLWMTGGALYFVPNRALGTSTSAAKSQKVARLPASITDNQVVLTDGTAGALKTHPLNTACNLFINALSTGSSIPTDNDYYVSQYVGGGTTTTSYHRRPVSALWSYIKGKMTSVSGVNISGNAATANSAAKVSTTEDTSNYLYILGVDSTDSNFNVIKRDTRLAAYGGKLMFTENSKGNYLGISGGQDASSVYSYLPPSGGTMISVTTQTEINMAITDNSNKVEFNMRKYAGVFAARETPIDDYYFYRGLATTTNPSNNIESSIHAGKYTLSEKCTLQFNTTTNALDFVFA